MADCKDCEELKGQDVNTEPHENLSAGDISLRADGPLSMFTCRQCKAQWRRHQWPKRTASGAKQRFWERL